MKSNTEQVNKLSKYKNISTIYDNTETMPKQSFQRKTKSNSTRKKKQMGMCRGYCCDATYHGLQHWYKSKFEKLGWMILAKSKGMNDKIVEYKNSLDRLHKAIQHKLVVHTCDEDNKDDLMIMHHNVGVLKEHVTKDFE